MFKYGHARNEGADASLSGGFATHILLRPGTAIYRIPDAVTDQRGCAYQLRAYDCSKRLRGILVYIFRVKQPYRPRSRHARYLCGVLPPHENGYEAGCCCGYSTKERLSDCQAFWGDTHFQSRQNICPWRN